MAPNGESEPHPHTVRPQGSCPICGGPVPQGNRHFPFCSKRCKLIDLGRWLGGRYRIESPLEATDRDVPPGEEPEADTRSEGTQ